MGLARTVLYPGHAAFFLFLHAPLLSQPELQIPNEFAALAL
jgi:hypothetical protein